jgi:hypothetical protein
MPMKKERTPGNPNATGIVPKIKDSKPTITA